MRVPLKTRTLLIMLVVLLAVSFSLFLYWIQEVSHYSKVVIIGEVVVLFLALVTGMVILNRTIQHAMERGQRQRNFLASVSHEFKTPLAGIRLAVETIALRDPPAEKRRQIVGRLLTELDRLETMVSRLLDTSRIEAGSVTCHPERMPLERVVAASVKGMEERALRRGVTMEVDVPRELTVTADPAAVRAVLDNLIDNAIKACGKRDNGRVFITAAPARSRVEMTISDNGVGFTREEAGKLFERFYRVGHGEHSKGGGSGLGLYIADRLLELNGASIVAHSRGIGNGATFTVSWPEGEEEGS